MRALVSCALNVTGATHQLVLYAKDGQRRTLVAPARAGADLLACARAVHAMAFSRASDAFARAHRAGLAAAAASWGDEDDDDDGGGGAKPPGAPAALFEKLPRTARYALEAEYDACVLRAHVKATYPRPRRNRLARKSHVGRRSSPRNIHHAAPPRPRLQRRPPRNNDPAGTRTAV